jgi:hypothetical protein
VLTGAKVREEIYQAFQAIYPVLQEFRKPWKSYPCLHAFHYFVGSIQLVQFINLLPSPPLPFSFLFLSTFSFSYLSTQTQKMPINSQQQQQQQQPPILKQYL